jgi:hypothetical protein
LGKEITTITLDEVELVFLYEEWPVDSLDGEERQHGRLELSIAEEQVLALDVAHKDYGAWSAHDVSAFRDGGWVSHLRKFVEQIRTEEKKRQEDAEVERLREVRDGFGSQRD